MILLLDNKRLAMVPVAQLKDEISFIQNKLVNENLTYSTRQWLTAQLKRLRKAAYHETPQPVNRRELRKTLW